MLLKDHNSYRWLCPADYTFADVASKTIKDHSAGFGIAKVSISDIPSHFKNMTLRILTKGLRTLRNFSLSYYPWYSGAVQ